MIIFLDIDGVLNQLQGNYYLDMYCVGNLITLCKRLNANIVLTSSWKKGFSLFGKNTPQVQNLKDILMEYNIEIIGRTSELPDRALEIKEYIRLNNISDYLILDDDISEFNGRYIENLFIINSKRGLTNIDVKHILGNIK